MLKKYDKLFHIFFLSTVIGVGISFSKLYLFHVMLIIILLLFMRSVLFSKNLINEKLPTNFHYIFYIMILWSMISLIWSINLYYALNYLFYIVCGLSIVLIIIYYATDLIRQKKIYSVLAIAFVAEIIICLLEAFTEFRWPISPYSEYVTLFKREMKIDMSLDESILSIIFSAPTGFQWNPNNLAVTMNIILPFFLFHKKPITKYSGIISILIILLYSGSRTNLLAFLFILGIYYFFYVKIKPISKILILLPILFVFILFVNHAKINYPPLQNFVNSYLAAQSFIADDIDDNTSLGTRQQLIKTGLTELMNSYGLGLGSGGSTAYFESIGGIEDKTTSMHNFWIELLVDMGILFFIVFILWYFYITYFLFKIYKKSNNAHLKYYSAACSLSQIGLLIGAISASSTIYLFPMWLLYGFGITTINNYKRVISQHPI